MVDVLFIVGRRSKSPPPSFQPKKWHHIYTSKYLKWAEDGLKRLGWAIFEHFCAPKVPKKCSKETYFLSFSLKKWYPLSLLWKKGRHPYPLSPPNLAVSPPYIPLWTSYSSGRCPCSGGRITDTYKVRQRLNADLGETSRCPSCAFGRL
jgi:hypothetical protein